MDIFLLVPFGIFCYNTHKQDDTYQSMICTCDLLWHILEPASVSD